MYKRTIFVVVNDLNKVFHKPLIYIPPENGHVHVLLTQESDDLIDRGEIYFATAT